MPPAGMVKLPAASPAWAHWPRELHVAPDGDEQVIRPMGLESTEAPRMAYSAGRIPHPPVPDLLTSIDIPMPL
eukprot:8358679-Pyramimonas_sp.AAC.1